MKLLDVVKAVGLALLILAVNLLVTVGLVFVYAQAVDPGQSFDHYTPVAMRIANWSAPIGAAVLLFGVTFLLTRRRPDRNALAFAATLWAAYAIIDASSALPSGDLAAVLSLHMALSMAVALAGALAGAALALRTRKA